jgi:hypothetical protein
MRRFAADLRSTGELRDDLTDDQVADIIWSMNAAEYWDLLVREREWTPAQFAEWLTDAWTRLLLHTPRPATRPRHWPGRRQLMHPGTHRARHPSTSGPLARISGTTATLSDRRSPRWFRQDAAPICPI